MVEQDGADHGEEAAWGERRVLTGLDLVLGEEGRGAGEVEPHVGRGTEPVVHTRHQYSSCNRQTQYRGG